MKTSNYLFLPLLHRLLNDAPQCATKFLEPLMTLNALMFYELPATKSQALESHSSCFFVASRLRGPIYSATKTPGLKAPQSSRNP